MDSNIIIFDDGGGGIDDGDGCTNENRTIRSIDQILTKPWRRRKWKLLLDLLFKNFLCLFSSLYFFVAIFLIVNNNGACAATTGNATDLNGKLDPQIAALYQTGNRSVNFTHLAIDHWGNLYAGGSNWLFQLNSTTLTVVEMVRTGPIPDSPGCSPTDCSGVDDSTILLRNNINKLLVVDEHNNALLVCGTVHQGACRKHRLGSIVHSEELIPLPVAANDENSSTLAFVGPSRYQNGNQLTPVLYVAVTDSRLGPYRDMVPAISSRSLESGNRYLSIIEKSFDSAKVDIEIHMKDYFLVNYIYGFSTPDFVYFATVQKRSHLRALEEWGYHTRLARVCQSDPAYNTYTEVTIECIGPDGQQYALLQDATLIEAGDELASVLRVKTRSKLFVGVFATAIEHTSVPDTRSAICVYPLHEIEQRFAQNIHLCYNGSVATRNMDYIAGNIPDCPAKRVSNIISFCSETLKINGSLPLTRRSAAIYSRQTLTSVLGQVTSSTAQNVLFVGTNDGWIKKLLLSNVERAEEFGQVQIDRNGHRILPDMLLDSTGKFLFCASPYVIAKVAIEYCPYYNTCRSCLNSKNPYCGWCSLQKSCTLRGQCLDQRTSVSSRWLSFDSSRCIEFQSIHPEHLPINSLDKVRLMINQLPRLPHNVSYQCVFGSNDPVQAEPMVNGLICQTPPVSARPRLPDGQDYVSVDLAIRPSDTRTDFLQRKFIFYDCNFYKTCSGCVQSRWSCQWCFKENRCVSSGYLCGTLSGNYTGNKYHQSKQQQVIRYKSECPSFNFTRSKSADILLSNGVAREISLPVQNLAFGNVLFGCLINIESRQTYVSARISDGNIVCSQTKFSYEAENATSVATVTAVWNQINFIDRINITLYKCPYLGSHNERSDCSICLNLDPVYDCSWCGNQCRHTEHCLPETPRAQLCPPPRIDLIHPLSGPIQGGTVITVEGSNLGVNAEEIRDKVLIGGYPCDVKNFSISVQFTCITRPVSKQFWADVVVGNRAGFTTARDKFLYASPEVISATPNSGPQSGGTRIYITGNHLSIGTSLSVYLDNLPCIVDKMLVSSTQISCRTTAAPRPNYTVSRIYVQIDNATLILDGPGIFRYVPDPTILRIYPLKSYVSGGRSVTVIGTNFDVIQQPRLAIFNVDGSFINDTVCEVVSASQMICPSPPVNSDLVDMIYREQQQMVDAAASMPANGGYPSPFMSNPDGSMAPATFEKISFRIGFIMDWVMSVRDLSVNYSTIHSDLIYVPDPKAFPFEEGIKEYKGDSLVIEGENLRLATSESEINVTIGTKQCNLTSLAQNQIVCIPPETQPDPTDEFGRRTPIYLPLVVVRIGNNLRHEIGYLRYDAGKGYELSLLTIGFIILFSLVLVVFVLVSFVFMRHKSLLAEREYKRIQMQMDTLENSVRSECKQAFAELQTDMTDLSNDLENCGVPILEHRNYVMKVFFPGVDDHPLFQTPRRSNNGNHQHNGSAYNIYELAMAQFEQLIYNKTFLVTFLNTLEHSQTFNIRDRVNVASLLMIILMERMEYATDILRTLLLQLVEKSVSSKYPQLMLRRTESVVEKMLTNWLALTMYDYMKNYAGSQLFLLFSAIKHQIEKGPVDVITHDARYSLSEERLLREHYSNYEQIILQVFQPDKPMEKYHVRVNDCDTITQIKMKILDLIFKNTPYSLRPGVNEYDIEWRDPYGNSILIRDIDHTSKREPGGWQRLNTLKHYQIKNMSLIMLIPKILRQQQQLYLTNTTKKSASSSSSPFYPLLASPISTNCSNSFANGFSTDIDNDHHWHLVKPSYCDDSLSNKDSSSGSSAGSAVLMHKAIPEIFLTRLLSTKGTIQKFIDDFFHTILVVNDALPVSIKWIFDLLDEAAIMYNITDPDVVHAWKSNCLPLRFWVNFIKNPNFIVDVNKTPTIDSNLSVIAQTLMDSCSSSDHRLGKDSPSSKLLFAKDIVNYRKLVGQFYQDVYHTQPVPETTLLSHMHSLNMAHQGEFDTVCALKELFVYAVKYHQEIVINLQNYGLAAAAAAQTNNNGTTSAESFIATQNLLEKFINLINYKF